MDKNKIAISTYNKVAHQYTDAYYGDLTDIPFIDSILESLPPNGNVLDVGCGPGTFISHLQSKGFYVEGIDFSEEMLRIAKEKNPQGIFKHMDMRTLEYENDSFDFLLSRYALIHIPSEEVLNTLKGFYRVLKQEGILAIIVQKGKPDFIVQEPFMASEKMFYNFFHVNELVNLLEKVGFQIISSKEEKTEQGEGLTDTMIYIVASK